MSYCCSGVRESNGTEDPKVDEFLITAELELRVEVMDVVRFVLRLS